MARQRNNIARLPFEDRMTVCDMMSDGCTYDEIRDRVKSDATLHNASFLAYKDGKEYQNFLASKMQSTRRFVAKRIQAATVTGVHGVDSVIKLSEATLIEQLQEFINAGDCDIKEMTQAATILNSLKKSLQLTRIEKLKTENETLKEQLKAQQEQYEATIAALTEEKQKSTGGLSKEALERIEEAAGLL